MAKLIVGIDFGTSTTVVRWRRENEDVVHTITDSNGMDSVIDSAIFIPKGGGNWIFGKQALNKSKANGTLVRNFKMDLIKPETETQAKVYVQKFMEHIYNLFIAQTQGVRYDSMDVYVSYPVKWPVEKKTLMKTIVSEAGFGLHGQVIGRTEPVATATELLRFHIPHLRSGGVIEAGKPLNVLMLDMGAGTSDLLLFQLTMSSNGEINIPENKMFQYPKNTQPLNCGGREIDNMLSRDVLNYLNKAIATGNVQDEWFDSGKAKRWKDCYVSEGLKGKKPTLCIDDIPYINQRINQFKAEGKWNNTVGEYKMSRNKFEAITESHWNNLYKLIENGMAKFKQQCGVSPDDIDLVLLTGGHSQWYCVPNLFNGKGINGTIAVDSSRYSALRFSKIIENNWCILQGEKPQETVANGLCWPNTISIPAIAENNIWIRIGINGNYSKYKQIVTKGKLLPHNVSITNDESETEYNTIMISQNWYYGIDRFNIELNLLEGDSIEHSMPSTFKFLLDKESKLGKWLGLVLTLGGAKSMIQDHKFSYTADFEVLEDGTLSLSGSLYYKGVGEKEVKFTEKDFSIL